MSLYYQDDLVTLYHGDCLTEHRDWLDADVLVTDPPYGVSWISGAVASSAARQKQAVAARARGELSVANDDSPAARDAALKAWGKRPAIVFGSWRVPRPERTVQRLIWYKVKTYPASRPAPWFSADEEIYVLGKGFGGSPHQNVYPTYRMMAGSHGLVAEVGHPTPKPVELMEQLIAKCPPGVIADPFAGSGSTLVAAVNQGRRAIGVELEERYCELIAKRLANQTATLDFGGDV